MKKRGNDFVGWLLLAAIFAVWPVVSLWDALFPPAHYYPRKVAAGLGGIALVLAILAAWVFYIGLWWVGGLCIFAYAVVSTGRAFVALFGDLADEDEAYIC